MALTDIIRQGYQAASRAFAPAQDNQQGTDDKSLIKEVEDIYKAATPFLQPMHRRYLEEILWYYGEHGMQFDARWGRFVVRPQRQYVPRRSANYILDICERLMSLVIKNMPEGRVVPEDESCEAQRQAENGNRIRKRLDEDDDLSLKNRTFAANLVILGNGLFLTGLDTKPRSATFTEQDPLTGEPVQVEVPLTDVTTLAVSPLEIIPNLHAKSPGEIREYIHCPAVTVDSLVEEFGSKARAVQSDVKVDSPHYFHMKILDLMTRSGAPGASGGYGLYSPNQEEAAGKTVIKKTFYRLPDKKHPQGTIRVVAGDVLLHDGPYTYIGEGEDEPRINLHWSRWSVLPGILWGFGAVRVLIDTQRGYNGMLTQAAMNRKIAGNNQWLAARGIGFSSEGSGAPGRTLYFTPKSGPLANHKPERLEPKGMAPDFWRELDNNEHQFDRASGFNDIMRGENPSGVTAGVSLEILAEQASGRFEPQIAEMRKTVVKRDEFRLSLVPMATAWKMGKQLLIQDEDGVPQMLKVSGSDISANPKIEMESAPPALFTYAAKQAKLNRALEVQLIDLTVPRNREMVRNALGVSAYADPVSADVKLAEFENYALMRGERVPVRRFEDSRIHLQTHRRLLLRPDFEQKPAAVRAAVEEHFLATMQGVKRIALDMEPEPDPQVLPAGGATPEKAGTEGVAGGEEQVPTE